MNESADRAARGLFSSRVSLLRFVLSPMKIDDRACASRMNSHEEVTATCRDSCRVGSETCHRLESSLHNEPDRPEGRSLARMVRAHSSSTIFPRVLWPPFHRSQEIITISRTLRRRPVRSRTNNAAGKCCVRTKERKADR